MQSFIVAIAGGTAGGKTTCAQAVARAAGPAGALVYLDSYYRDQSRMPLAQRALVNYDHPAAFEFDLLNRHLLDLLQGRTVEMPNYDFSLHTRVGYRPFAPAPIIIVEGILVLYPEDLRRLYDLKIFVDTPADLRLARRIERDMRERGRSRESVLQQWQETVEPMHVQYCEPTREYADWIVSGTEAYEGVVEKIVMMAHAKQR